MWVENCGLPFAWSESFEGSESRKMMDVVRSEAQTGAHHNTKSFLCSLYFQLLSPSFAHLTFVERRPAIADALLSLVERYARYLAHPFLKSERERHFWIGLVYNLLQAYACNYNFLHVYGFNPTENSTFSWRNLSVKRTSYCNFMHPADCKEMGIITKARERQPLPLPKNTGGGARRKQQ